MSGPKRLSVRTGMSIAGTTFDPNLAFCTPRPATPQNQKYGQYIIEVRAFRWVDCSEGAA